MGSKARHCYINGVAGQKFDVILFIDSHSDGVSSA